MRNTALSAALVLLVVAAGAAQAAQFPPAAPAGQVVYFGHVKSLAPSGSGYVLRFDPAWFLEGTAAQRAAVADGVVPAGEPVPNDYYVRDESHKLLTFRVPKTARVTVLTNAKGITGTTVGVAELVQLLMGRNPKHRALLGSPADFGFWIRVRIDTVRSLDAQYQP